MSTVSPVWLSYTCLQCDKPTYFTESISVDRNGILYWPISDFAGTTINSVNLNESPLENDILRLNAKPDVVNRGPIVRAMTTSGKFIFATGDDFVGGSDVAFIAAINPSIHDTLWMKYLRDSIGVIAKSVSAIAADDSSIYTCIPVQQGGGSVVARYDFSGQNLYMKTQRPTLFCGKNLIVDDSFLYVCGTTGVNAGALGVQFRPIVAKYRKEDGTFIDSVLIGSQDSANFTIGTIYQIALKGNVLYAAGYTADPSRDSDVFVASLTKDLSINWERIWGGKGYQEAKAMILDDSANIWLGFSDVVLEYSQQGELVFSGECKVEGLQINSLASYKGNIYGGGQKNHVNSGHDVVMFDGCLLMIDPNSSLNVPNKPDKHEPVIYPNPIETSALLYFDDQHFHNAALTISDPLGRIMKRTTDVTTSPFNLERGGLAPGVYFYSLIDQSGIIATGKIVVQ
jgi:hypothetical protein